MNTWATSNGTTISRICSGRSNAYLVAFAQAHVMVDTGTKRPVEQFANCLRNLHANGIDALVLTHSHYDHAENSAALKRRFGAQIVIHKTDADYLARGDSPVSPGSVFATRWMTRRVAQLVRPLLRYEPVDADVAAEDGDDCTHWGINAFLLHTPGHSRGSMSLIVDGEIAIVGDAMMGVYPGTVFIPFADDVPEMVRSWKRLLETGCRLFLPGHGHAIDREFLENQYERIAKKYLHAG
ncbi:MAG TPA: MBL fold metallo-hydrolase [Bacteroidota bacterium]|nr:MBL fold metallo-hydrolase [Bacteroidota bacterium]